MKISRRALLITGGIVGGGLAIGLIGVAGTAGYMATHELRGD